jgi:hypothetical protein
MVKRLILTAAIVLATWSVATASYAGFSIDLPGFSMHLPLPGAGIHLGLPVVGVPATPVYQSVEVYQPPVYVRPARHSHYYEARPYYRHVPRNNDYGYNRYGDNCGRDYYRYR